MGKTCPVYNPNCNHTLTDKEIFANEIGLGRVGSPCVVSEVEFSKGIGKRECIIKKHMVLTHVENGPLSGIFRAVAMALSETVISTSLINELMGVHGSAFLS